MKWISINDGKPEDGKDVLAYYTFRYLGKTVGKYGVGIRIGNRIAIDTGNGVDIGVNVKYWAPIAPLPKDGD